MPRESTMGSLRSDGSTDKKATPHDDAGNQSTVAYQQITPSVSTRYKPLQFHAKGGVGEVWVAEDEEIGRQVALKRLLRNEEGNHFRFLAEAQIAGQLEHPSIVPVHDLGIDKSGLPYYVMKFVHGQTLREAIEDYHAADRKDESERRLLGRRLLEHLINICEAVAFAHTRGVVHRDLKPSNVMLGLFGETIVLDWGLAKVLNQPDLPGMSTARTSSGRSTETVQGSVIGTPSYMPPELAEGKAADAGTSVDIYLLGATLYEILTGTAPRKGTSRDEILELARTVDPKRPCEINKLVPRPLEAICMKAMSKRASSRYATAMLLADDVRRFLADEPVTSYLEPPLKRLWRWGKRHRRALSRAAAAATILAISLGSLVALQESRRRTMEAEHDAAVLMAEKQARGDVDQFRMLAEDANFKIGLDDADEQFTYYDAKEGHDVIDQALAIATPWGDELDGLPLVDERDSIRRDLYELLLRRAQVGLLENSTDSSDSILADLNRAASYGEPTRGFYQLRAAYNRLMGDADEATSDEAQASSNDVRVDAFDHFLTGEQFRLASIGALRPLVTSNEPRGQNLQSAIAEYRAALQTDPDHYWSRLQLGRCYLATRHTGEAIETLGACIALRPEGPWAYTSRAMALAQDARYDEAIEDLNHVLSGDPGFLPALLNRGWIHWRQKNLPDAITDLMRAATTPENGLALADFYLGQIHLAQDDLPKALNHFNRFANAGQMQSFWIVHKYLASVQFLLGNDTQGQQHLDQYLSLRSSDVFDPKAASTRLDRGKFLLALTTRDIALLRAKAIQNQNVPRARQLIAIERNLLGLAEVELNAAAGLKSEDSYLELGRVTERIAILERSAEGFKTAIEHYSAGLEVFPDSISLLNKRGSNLRTVKQQALAKDDYLRATRIQPKNDSEVLLVAEAHSWVGILLTEAGEVDEAIRHAARSLAVLFSVDEHQQAFGVLHNIACIYGGVSQTNEDHRVELEDMAIEILAEAVSRAKRAGREALEREAIRVEEEPFFGPELKARPEFQSL